MKIILLSRRRMSGYSFMKLQSLHKEIEINAKKMMLNTKGTYHTYNGGFFRESMMASATTIVTIPAQYNIL
jgi:hypothetical protein